MRPAKNRSPGAKLAPSQGGPHLVVTPQLIRDRASYACFHLKGCDSFLAYKVWEILNAKSFGGSFKGTQAGLVTMAIGNPEGKVSAGVLKKTQRTLDAMAKTGMIEVQKTLTGKGHQIHVTLSSDYIIPQSTNRQNRPVDQKPVDIIVQASGHNCPGEGPLSINTQQDKKQNPPISPQEGGREKAPENGKVKNRRKPPEYSAAFLEAWEVYPHRPGGRPKKPAWDWWQRNLEAGYTAGAMIRAVKNYRRERDREEAQGSPSRYRKVFRNFLSDSQDPGNAPFKSYLTDQEGGEDDPYGRFSQFE